MTFFNMCGSSWDEDEALSLSFKLFITIKNTIFSKTFVVTKKILVLKREINIYILNQKLSKILLKWRQGKKTSNFNGNFWQQVPVNANFICRYEAEIPLRVRQCIISFWRGISGADEYLLLAREKIDDAYSIRMRILPCSQEWSHFVLFYLTSSHGKKKTWVY